MIKFNMNEEVAVELRDISLTVIREKINGTEEFKDDYMKHCILPHVFTKGDKKYIWIQLWEAMYYFGDKMVMGSRLACGLDIYIKEEKLETVNEF